MKLYDILAILFSLLILSIIGILIFGPYIEKQECIQKDIIEKTEKYNKYDYCVKIDDSWYCWD